MRILVTFAVEREFRPWRRQRRFGVSQVGGQTLHGARIGEADVAVLLTGIGPEAAGAKMMALLMGSYEEQRGFDVCISSGLAGGLRPQHRVGEVLAARMVSPESVDAAFGREGIDGDSRLLVLAEECGAKVVGKFWTAPRIIASAEEKAQLGAIADAVEMESFAVLKEASAWCAGGIAIRSVSDTGETNLPYDFTLAVDSQGRIKPLPLLREIVHRPQGIPGLLRLARDSRKASVELAMFLDRYVQRLAEFGAEAFAEAPELEMTAT